MDLDTLEDVAPQRGSQRNEDKGREKDRDRESDEEEEAVAAGAADGAMLSLMNNKDKMRELVAAFTPEQTARYEVFRRSGLNKPLVKKVIQQQLNAQPAATAVFVMAGIAKVYVGELVETALEYQREIREKGPLAPKHLREAVRRMKNKGLVPQVHSRKRLLRR